MYSLVLLLIRGEPVASLEHCFVSKTIRNGGACAILCLLPLDYGLLHDSYISWNETKRSNYYNNFNSTLLFQPFKRLLFAICFFLFSCRVTLPTFADAVS